MSDSGALVRCNAWQPGATLLQLTSEMDSTDLSDSDSWLQGRAGLANSKELSKLGPGSEFNAAKGVSGWHDMTPTLPRESTDLEVDFTMPTGVSAAGITLVPVFKTPTPYQRQKHWQQQPQQQSQQSQQMQQPNQIAMNVSSCPSSAPMLPVGLSSLHLAQKPSINLAMHLRRAGLDLEPAQHANPSFRHTKAKGSGSGCTLGHSPHPSSPPRSPFSAAASTHPHDTNELFQDAILQLQLSCKQQQPLVRKSSRPHSLLEDVPELSPASSCNEFMLEFQSGKGQRRASEAAAFAGCCDRRSLDTGRERERDSGSLVPVSAASVLRATQVAQEASLLEIHKAVEGLFMSDCEMYKQVGKQGEMGRCNACRFPRRHGGKKQP